LWIWLAFIFTIPIGIVAGLLNLAALIATDNDFIRNIEEIENEKDNSR
jgi:hypothetical protein